MQERNLIISGNTTRSCLYCIYYRTTQLGGPYDQGICSAYSDPVRGDFVCDTFISTVEVAGNDSFTTEDK